MDHGKRDANSSDGRLAPLIDRIIEARNCAPTTRALLVGISGIDSSGKGFVTAKVAEVLRARSWHVAVVSADDWLNLPQVCIDPDNYAEHFYEQAIRFEEMFESLILPLGKERNLTLTADVADAKATVYRNHTYEFDDIDIVLLEGIFIFKPEYRKHFDLRVWIDCSFECALERAIERGQEGLSPPETIKAFETIYFPAQRIHLARDKPRDAAHIMFANDNL
jgi:uridine kinase